MNRRTFQIITILISVVLAGTVAGYAFNGGEGGPDGWLRGHVGDEMLITLQVSFIDEIGKVLIARLIEVEEAGIVVTLIGDVTSERDGRADHGDRITLWTEKKAGFSDLFQHRLHAGIRGGEGERLEVFTAEGKAGKTEMNRPRSMHQGIFDVGETRLEPASLIIPWSF